MFLLGGIGIINTATTDLNKNVDMVREVILSSKLFFLQGNCGFLNMSCYISSFLFCEIINTLV
jgi:hypothetical protein